MLRSDLLQRRRQLPSPTCAHEFTATVAPFRAWRGLQLFAARGPVSYRTAKDTPRRVRVQMVLNGNIHQAITID